MASYDVVCVGSSVVDIPLQPVDRSVFDSVSYPVEDISMRVGGDALNESIILSRLGAKVALVTAVGDDAAGNFILESATRAGVDVTGTTVREGLTTSLNVGLVRPDGERTFITNRNGSLWKTEESDIQADAYLDGRILAFGSIFNNPLLSGAWMAELFAKAKKAEMTVCADMVPSRIGTGLNEISQALRYVDYFFPNADEAVALTAWEPWCSRWASADALSVEKISTPSFRLLCEMTWSRSTRRVRGTTLPRALYGRCSTVSRRRNAPCSRMG